MVRLQPVARNLRGPVYKKLSHALRSRCLSCDAPGPQSSHTSNVARCKFDDTNIEVAGIKLT